MNEQNNNFIHRKTFDVSSEKKHKEDLGLEIPKDYFAKSKKSILDQTVNESKGKVINLSRRVYLWSSVAVIALLLGFTFFNPFKGDILTPERDILIATVMVDDDEVDDLLDEFVNDELLTEEVFTE
ncbi:hypothetical protein SAMN04489761_2298 [Tenacibaculum sp. MAR_2009_124]|uniref:hypothetical protein n=1 Tax=Tenacibaculum sp. MAR_2009_124 TaxID=1250059 RepID=UPI000895A1EC|nr:hypothetical protein [Tenacibaculum sp. MAR_2009_124]SEC17678.1 hypothetical protein SAMN04489761_2298 [Tenacibaculum sp. MAR_2009_124]